MNAPPTDATPLVAIVGPTGSTLDSLSETYDRRNLKLFFNREVNYWDFTTPFAHLECSGFGAITYRFVAGTAFDAAALTLWSFRSIHF